jgi:glycosyltransferase involved in cell wall biosynthesis
MIITHLGPAAVPITHTRGGAIQRRVLEVAKLQAARGDKVIVYSADRECGRMEYRGVEIRSMACRGRGYLRDCEYQLRALHDLRSEKVDILHFHGLPEGAMLFNKLNCKKFLSYDYFVFRRGKKTPLYWWYRKALRKFSCLLPVSAYCSHESQDYWNLHDTPRRVLHNGVNLQQFCSQPASGLARKRALGMEAERIILYVGRVCRQKGTDLLIDAYLRIRPRYPSVRLVVAGPAMAFGQTGESDLTRRIATCGGVYLGPVAEDELASIYNMADIFVMPTREAEMFGMAAVEAQACGKPVVASRHGGLPEVISDQSGVFFPSGDDSALAQQLCNLLQAPRLCQSLAQKARTSAMRFAWPRIADELETVYSHS